MKSKILFLASGTLGDVQPYVALGVGLQRAGLGVRIVTHPEFHRLVEGRDLEYSPLHGNPSEPMTRPGGQSALTFDGNWVRSLRASLAYLRQVRPVYLQMLESAWLACQAGSGASPSAIIVGLPTTWGAHIAETLGIPCIWAFLQPVARTHAYPSALLPSTFSLGPAYNRLTHRIVEAMTVLPWRSLIRTWRSKSLGLRQPVIGSPLAAIYTPGAYVLYGYSPWVAPPPRDWPPHHIVTGYWFLDADPGYTPPPELERFIAGGTRPVYIGFGSPGNRSPQDTLKIVLRALEVAGLRAVLAYPPEQAGEVRLPPSVCLASQVPHAWLFPRMAGLVHHGGAGTTAAGLRAGTPALAAPLAVDQFFWGQRLAALKAGPQPIPQRDLTASRLGSTMQDLVKAETYRASAARLSAALSAEDGVTRAVEYIREWTQVR